MQIICFNLITLSCDSSPDCRPQTSTTAQGGCLIVTCGNQVAANIASCAGSPPGAVRRE